MSMLQSLFAQLMALAKRRPLTDADVSVALRGFYDLHSLRAMSHAELAQAFNELFEEERGEFKLE
jgi:hypothetical protein